MFMYDLTTVQSNYAFVVVRCFGGVPISMLTFWYYDKMEVIFNWYPVPTGWISALQSKLQALTLTPSSEKKKMKKI